MKAIDYYNLGIQFKKNPSESQLAILNFQKAIELFKNGDKTVHLGHCYWYVSVIQHKLGHLDQARNACEQALYSYSDSKNKADCYYELGKITQAMRWPYAATYFKKAKKYFTDKRDKANCDFHIGLVYLHIGAGNDKKAIKAFYKAQEGYTDLSAKAECHFQCAEVYRSQCRILYRQIFNIKSSLPLAIEEYNKAILLVANNDSLLSEYLFHRGLAYAEQNEHSKAILDFSQALDYAKTDLNPNLPFIEQIYRERTSSYFKIGHYELALLDYTLLLKINPKARIYLEDREIKNIVINYPDFYESTLKDILSEEKKQIAEKTLASLNEGQDIKLSNKLSAFFNMKSDLNKHLLKDAAYNRFKSDELATVAEVSVNRTS